MTSKKYKPKPIVFNVGANVKYLIIVESPSKCSKIEHYLGSKYSCIASIGHFRHINGLKSIDMNGSYEPTFSILSEKKAHVDAMRAIISKFPPDNVIIASDDDREGEAIAWHICDVFKLPIETTKRIVFHEVTKDALQRAVEQPTVINMQLVRAQHARQVLDMLMGYKISPYLWKYLYNNKENSLSAGRCQTPALRLVYENSILDNQITQKYKVYGYFLTPPKRFDLTVELNDSTIVRDFMEKSKTYDHKLTTGSPRSVQSLPPKPLTTSRLLQVSSNTLRLSPRETMEVCQKLYQNGYITYMRTECSRYSKTFFDSAAQFVKDTWSSKYLGAEENIVSTDTSNPHEAIRVTQIRVRSLPDCEDKRMSSMYKLIWKNTIESCMATATYENTTIHMSAPTNLKYKHIVENPTFDGWKIVENPSNKLTDVQCSQSGFLFYVRNLESNDTRITYSKICGEVIVHSPHKLYSEATLIQKLEELGIGRPSTFASIVSTIQDRGYVQRMDTPGQDIECQDITLIKEDIDTTVCNKTFGSEKQKLVIQPVGTVAVEFLIQHFEKLFSYTYTEKMEVELDRISNGEITNWSSLCTTCVDQIKEYAKSIENLHKQTYEIAPGYEYIFEKYGPAIKHTNDDGSIEYIPAKKNMKMDLAKLQSGGYTLDELIEINSKQIGDYNGEPVYIKKGRYGLYIECGDLRENAKSIDKPLEDVDYEDIKHFLEANKSSKTGPEPLRVLNHCMNVIKGKFGAYVYYKEAHMKSPRFLNIKKCPHGFLNCEADVLIKWLCETYHITLKE